MHKVLAIAPYNYLPWFSGGQKFIGRFLENLGARTELTVVTVKENDFTLVKNYRTLPWLKKNVSRYVDSSLTKKITELVKSEGFDTIIWEHPYYAWLANAVKKKTGIHTIIHTHNIEYQRFRSTGRWWWPVLKAYEKWFFKKADRIFFITPEDRQFAIDHWQIPEAKCVELPFGIDVNQYPPDRTASREWVMQKHGIDADEKILLFNGLLDYGPNLDALRVILDKVNPELLQVKNFRYRLIVCGARLPENLKGLASYGDKHITYAGFVDDISIYFKAADVFLNPVQTGGGIKTKMVEAIAYGANVVSTESSATGISRKVCGEKLSVVEDDDWEAFTLAIIKASSQVNITPEAYYHFYDWKYIIENILQS